MPGIAPCGDLLRALPRGNLGQGHACLDTEYGGIDRNAEKSQRAMKAMLGMKKIDIEELQRAYAG